MPQLKFTRDQIKAAINSAPSSGMYINVANGAQIVVQYRDILEYIESLENRVMSLALTIADILDAGENPQ